MIHTLLFFLPSIPEPILWVLNISLCFHRALFTSCSRILHPESRVHPRAPWRTLSSVSSSLRHWAPSSPLSFFCPCDVIPFFFSSSRWALRSLAETVSCSFEDTCFLFGVECFSWLLAPFTRSCLHIWAQKDPFNWSVSAGRDKNGRKFKMKRRMFFGALHSLREKY